jgi:hypothetical protein
MNPNQHKATLEPIVHLPIESNQAPSSPEADKRPLAQTKDAMLQAVAALWRQIMVSMKKIQTHIQ